MDFLLAHGLDLLRLITETAAIIWALAKYIDKALTKHIFAKLSNHFMSKSDGDRIEEKVDKLLLGAHRARREKETLPRRSH